MTSKLLKLCHCFCFLLSLFALKAERDFYVQIFKMALHHSEIPITFVLSFQIENSERRLILWKTEYLMYMIQ